LSKTLSCSQIGLYKRHLSLKIVLFYSHYAKVYRACIQRPENVTVPQRGVQHLQR